MAGRSRREQVTSTSQTSTVSVKDVSSAAILTPKGIHGGWHRIRPRRSGPGKSAGEPGVTPGTRDVPVRIATDVQRTLHRLETDRSILAFAFEISQNATGLL